LNLNNHSYCYIYILFNKMNIHILLNIAMFYRFIIFVLRTEMSHYSCKAATQKAITHPLRVVRVLLFHMNHRFSHELPVLEYKATCDFPWNTEFNKTIANKNSTNSKYIGKIVNSVIRTIGAVRRGFGLDRFDCTTVPKRSDRYFNSGKSNSMIKTHA